MQPRNSANLKGIDVSHYNGHIDWKKVKASGVDFVYVKASEGLTYTDPLYVANVKAAREAGIQHVGSYHFAHPNNDPVKEADHFIAVTNLVKDGNLSNLPHVLDLESVVHASPDILVPFNYNSWIRAFMERVKSVTKHGVVLYTYSAFISEQKINTTEYPLWLANYSSATPADVNGFTKWTVWQYSEKGTVNGITGYVDLDEADASLVHV